jgi:hypothetical protein
MAQPLGYIDCLCDHPFVSSEIHAHLVNSAHRHPLFSLHNKQLVFRLLEYDDPMFTEGQARCFDMRLQTSSVAVQLSTNTESFLFLFAIIHMVNICRQQPNDNKNVRVQPTSAFRGLWLLPSWVLTNEKTSSIYKRGLQNQGSGHP